MMQFFSHMVQNASCTGLDSNVLASAITAFAALAGIWLRHWLESRKSNVRKNKAKASSGQDRKRSLLDEFFQKLWKFGA